ncbi:MAG: recombinase family protein [Lachnospiraceae bacterium]|nr:recombinase family protein [Lachnospiraceae bacterium]
MMDGKEPNVSGYELELPACVERDEQRERSDVSEYLETEPEAWRNRHENREERKQRTRERIRNASAGDAVLIKADELSLDIDDSEHKVGVYVRVSTASEEQVSSYENQKKYYTEKVTRNPKWELVDIYADEGKSGTSMKKRTEFLRMLEDAKNKKIDLILCASVSRFARNVGDFVNEIQKLQTQNPRHPVGVYFETEHLNTLNPDAGVNLQVHAMLADWESANKSRRMILSYDQRICTGQYPLSDLLGYRHTQDGRLVVVEEEAVTVRYIFFARLSGQSNEEIAETLTEYRRPTLKGRTEWNAGMVGAIMLNERRWGDLMARKTVVLNYKEQKVVKNERIRDAAFVEKHHEGIVTPEIARAVHMLSASRLRHTGVPEVGVIRSGGLKGFVSLNPSFNGIDHDTILELSRSAYSEDEYEEIEHRSRIINGEEHSRISHMDFTGYYVPYSAFFIGRDTPTLTISRRQLKFNKKCYERLGSCERIELLYHPLLQTLVIRNSDGEMGFPWVNEHGKWVSSFNGKAFCEAVYEEQDWITDYTFRFRGITRARGNRVIMAFYLDEPQIVKTRASQLAAESVEAEQIDLPSRYIPIKNSELAAKTTRNGNGMLYPLRKKRDSIINSLTASDIEQDGDVAVNPLIGDIPSHESIAEEMELLLMSM